jgi:aspartate ammonia-lyase
VSDRIEHDLLGERAVPAEVLWGINALRSSESTPLSGRNIDPQLIHSYGTVKRACIIAARKTGAWSGNVAVAEAIEKASAEVASGLFDHAVIVDALAGGAGTGLNMNINEIIANRALELLGQAHGDYRIVSPVSDVNKFQSTNDTFPTALRHAAIVLLRDLEAGVVRLQEALLAKEKEFADVVKVGRTEYQDAVLTTLGREMGAYAEAIGRDRWRIYKCEERLRTVNLGGTAIGTGITAPRDYIFAVVPALCTLTGIGFARAENLVEATQNADVYVEVSGILCALGANLQKIAGDLRFMSSGPQAGIGEIALPALQAGSSIMPGKVNPVVPEAVMQAAMMQQGLHAALCSAVGAGSLELNAFLPLIADALLQELRILTSAVIMFEKNCIRGITVNREVCRRQVDNSIAVATALLPLLGYERMADVVAEASAGGATVKQIVIDRNFCTEAQFNDYTSPEAVCRLGMPQPQQQGS